MVIHNALDNIVNNAVKTKILRLLCRDKTLWTGRQLAKEVGVSPTTVNKFLKDLVDEGVVNVKGAGSSYLYSLNDNSYLVKNILMPFFEKEKGAYRAIVTLIKREFLRSGARIKSLAIFGSVADRTQTSKSDIDLLVILDNLKDKAKIEKKVDGISSKVARNFQTAISPYIISTKQFRKKHKDKSPVINEILRSYILIEGASPERIIV